MQLQTIKDVIYSNTAKYPEKVAFIFEDKQYSFSQINGRVNSLLNGLKSIGIKKSDHIGILAYNCPQYFETFTLAKAGLVIVPLNYRLVASELEFVVSNSEINTLIFEKEFLNL